MSSFKTVLKLKLRKFIEKTSQTPLLKLREFTGRGEKYETRAHRWKKTVFPQQFFLLS
jgi:hypothetical protein